MKEPIMVNAQSSIKICGEVTIYFDPFGLMKETHDADYVFITHPHWDHFSLLDILRVKKGETCFFVPKEIFEELLDIGIPEEQIRVVEPNRHYSFAKFEFKTIPAYNLNSKHHPRDKKWVGYLLDFENVTYYIAGDTDLTKETQEVKADVIFLPVGGTYTMDAIDAARLANIIKPKLAIPTHYATAVGTKKDAQIFKKRLEKEIKCKIYFEGEKHEE